MNEVPESAECDDVDVTDAAGGAELMPVGLSPELAKIAAVGIEFTEQGLATSTRENYEYDFKRFVHWCDEHGLESLPAEPGTVFLYVSYLGDAKDDDGEPRYAVSTLERRLAAIRWKHEHDGYLTPTSHVKIAEVMKGVRQKHGRPARQKAPLTTITLGKMVDALDLGTVAGLRDRAILLVGYAGAFRRSELASLAYDRITRRVEGPGGEGFVVQLVRSKDDRDRTGRYVGIPVFAGSALCPVAALDAWLERAQISSGMVFRRIDRWGNIRGNGLNAASIARIVKRSAVAAGLPNVRELAGHSLRAGHATQAAANDAPDRIIMRTTGHSSVETLEGYIRAGDILTKNSARYLGLDVSGSSSVDEEASPT